MNNRVLSPLVLLHWLLAVELLLADVTFKGSMVGVGSFVHPEIPFLRILLAANLAREGLFSSVRYQVSFHCCHANELLSTYPADGNHLGGSLSIS